MFEDIGKFAGATNYDHVALHLELEDLQAPILAYRHIIERTKKTIKGFDVSAYSKEGLKPTFLLKDLIQNLQTAHQVILDQAKVKQAYFQADLQDRTHHLITVNNQHTLQLQEHTIIHDLASHLTITTLQNPAITLSDLGLIERNITRALEITCNTFQAAQLRRLSINSLSDLNIWRKSFEKCKTEPILRNQPQEIQENA